MLHCVPGEQKSRLGPSIFSFFCFCYLFSWVSHRNAHHQFILLSPIKGAWRNNFSGPGTLILKTVFLCINGARNPLLIHGIWPVNARLLIAYGTALYAIMEIVKTLIKRRSKRRLIWVCTVCYGPYCMELGILFSQ